jgi:FkbM family methyltransferase
MWDFKRKATLLGQILREGGPSAGAEAVAEAVGKWWRKGEFWELRKSEYVRLDGCRIALENSDPSDLRSQLTRGVYEWPERTAIRGFLDQGLPVVELGGSIGVVACITNRRLRNPERHIVVEANRQLIPKLTANRDRNQGKFAIWHKAIGYQGSVVQMHIDEENPLASSAVAGNGTLVDVPATTLTEIMEHAKFERATLICDIEGAEFDLVEREAALLTQRVSLIIMEVHERMVGPKITEAMFKTLKDAHFEVVRQFHETYVFKNSLLSL